MRRDRRLCDLFAAAAASFSPYVTLDRKHAGLVVALFGYVFADALHAVVPVKQALSKTAPVTYITE